MDNSVKLKNSRNSKNHEILLPKIDITQLKHDGCRR